MSILMGPALAAELQARWKWFVALGVILAILGLVALYNAVDATLVTTIFVGFLLMAGGIAQLIAAFTGSGSTGGRILAAVLGVLYVIVGFNLVADPLTGAIALTIVVALMLIISGIIRMVGAVADRPDGWGLIAVLGALSVLLGVWLWSGIPYSGVAIGFFVGFDLLFTGISWVVLGWQARSLSDRGMTSRA